MLGLAGKIALSSPPFCLKHFSHGCRPWLKLSPSQLLARPRAMVHSLIRSARPHLSPDLQKSVKMTLALALQVVEC